MRHHKAKSRCVPADLLKLDMTCTQEAGTSGTDSHGSTHAELARSPATQTFILQSSLRLLSSCEPCAAQHAVVIGTPAQLLTHIHLIII